MRGVATIRFKPLFQAIKNGDVQTVQCLLKAGGATLNCVLYWAAFHEQTGIAVTTSSAATKWPSNTSTPGQRCQNPHQPSAQRPRRYIHLYNHDRQHSALGGKTPDEVHFTPGHRRCWPQEQSQHASQPAADPLVQPRIVFKQPEPLLI